MELPSASAEVREENLHPDVPHFCERSRCEERGAVEVGCEHARARLRRAHRELPRTGAHLEEQLPRRCPSSERCEEEGVLARRVDRTRNGPGLAEGVPL
ncbi:MAG: hypothetical protein L3K07_01165 [Thermoplasmata archaeon]|nr:hypothetical protein [Thermoplasmata archaeon]